MHLTSGRNHNHILTEPEIRLLGEESNRTDLLNLLIIEKGQAAHIMMENIDLVEPKEIQYTRPLVELLLRDLETDYYNRFKFNDL